MNIRDQWLTLVKQVYFLGVSVSTFDGGRGERQPEGVASSAGQMPPIEHIPADDACNGTGGDEWIISLRED